MKRQEQIEKMADAIPAIVGKEYLYGMVVNHRELVAVELQKAGYINGADFVEFLKKDIRDTRNYAALSSNFMPNCVGYDMAIEHIIKSLAEALQEYLNEE